MRKVHPNTAGGEKGKGKGKEKEKEKGKGGEEGEVGEVGGEAVSMSMSMTVWKKSLVPNCKGFTVFDCAGNMVFRVDTYCRRMRTNHDDILLMDAAGTPLLTIRRKRRAAGLQGEKWAVYEGEGEEEEAAYWGKKEGKGKVVVESMKTKCRYETEGSYAQRCCAVYDQQRRRVAEIRKKESSVVSVGGVPLPVAFGADVFRLMVQPHLIHPSLAMAFLILLDHIS